MSDDAGRTDVVERVEEAADGSSAERPNVEDDDVERRFELEPRSRRALRWAAIAGLGLVALVATVGLYTSVRTLISVWVADAYQPLFEAVFNLVVLLLAGIGVSRLARGFGVSDPLN